MSSTWNFSGLEENLLLRKNRVMNYFVEILNGDPKLFYLLIVYCKFYIFILCKFILNEKSTFTFLVKVLVFNSELFNLDERNYWGPRELCNL